MANYDQIDERFRKLWVEAGRPDGADAKQGLRHRAEMQLHDEECAEKRRVDEEAQRQKATQTTPIEVHVLEDGTRVEQAAKKVVGQAPPGGVTPGVLPKSEEPEPRDSVPHGFEDAPQE